MKEMRHKHFYALVLLAVLFIAEATLVQSLVLEFKAQRLLVTVSMTGVILCLPHWAKRIIAVFQAIVSLLIIHYVHYLTEPPTMSSIINGSHLLTEIGWAVMSHVLWLPTCLCLISLVSKNILSRYTPVWLGRYRYATMITCFIIISFIWFENYRKELFFVLEENKTGFFDNRTVKLIKRRGYIAVWIQELLENAPKEQRLSYVGEPCNKEMIAELDLPIWKPSAKVAIIQVESLDYSAIGFKKDGALVAPHLTQLAQNGLFIEIEGTKKLASANSDYELFTGNIASNSVCHYEYAVAYPTSIIAPVAASGIETAVIHGIRGSYMNLKEAYRKLGFTHRFFEEDLVASGIPKRKDLFMHNIPDADMLRFAEGKIPANNPFLHFIISITMHGENSIMVPDYSVAPSYTDTLRYFDTALGHYLEALPADTLVIVYGDHQSYDGPKRTGTVPFIMFQKNVPFLRSSVNIPILTRCELSYYLAKTFHHVFGMLSPVDDVLLTPVTED